MKKNKKALAPLLGACLLGSLFLAGCTSTSKDNEISATGFSYGMGMTNDVLAQQPANWRYVGKIIEIDSEQKYAAVTVKNFEVKYVPVLIEITEGADSIGEQIWYQLNTNIGANYDFSKLQVGKTVVVQATQEQFERDGGRKLAPVHYIGVVGEDGAIINVQADDKLKLTLEDYRKGLDL
jgi:hypothetical protein